MKIMKIKQEIKIGDTTFIFNSPNILDESTTDMMNDWCRLVEQQQIIDEAYKNYVNWWEYDDNSVNLSDKESEKWLKLVDGGLQWGVLLKEEFINKCKTNPEFSEMWGLKIEERELSVVERMEYYGKYFMKEAESKTFDELCQIDYDKLNIPTRLITITYKEQTIESYE